MAGRRTKKTDPRKEAILNALRSGLTRNAACGISKVDRGTLWRWMQASATFRDAVCAAEDEAEARFTATIASAARAGDWKASLAWLERRRRDDWKDSKHVTLEIEKMTDAELVSYIATEATESGPAGDSGSETKGD